MGVAAPWHFRLAGGALVAVVAVELVGQALHGTSGAGPASWLALMLTGAWVLGLVWRERVGIVRAWMCGLWVLLGGFVAAVLGVRHGLLGFTGVEPVSISGVPLSVPLLCWVLVGGAYLVVEALWGEWRAGLSLFTALIALQLALMLLPLLGTLRGYARWADGPVTPLGVPARMLMSSFIAALLLAFGLVVLGDNWSSAEARNRRQAWVPAAAMLLLTLVCVGPNVLTASWVPIAFTMANGVLFGAVLVWYLRGRRLGG
jgi:hypothetical protein